MFSILKQRTKFLNNLNWVPGRALAQNTARAAASRREIRNFSPRLVKSPYLCPFTSGNG